MQKDDVYIAKGEKVIVGSNKPPKLIHMNPENIKRKFAWLDKKLIFEELRYSTIS